MLVALLVMVVPAAMVVQVALALPFYLLWVLMAVTAETGLLAVMAV